MAVMDNHFIVDSENTVICADCNEYIETLDEETREKFSEKHKGHKFVFVQDLEEFK